MRRREYPVAVRSRYQFSDNGGDSGGRFAVSGCSATFTIFPMASIGLIFVRLAVATVLFAHGAHTLFGTFASPGIGPGGIDHTTTQFAALGLQPASIFAVAAGLAQLLGAIMILAGWYTRWGAGANFLYLLVGVWKEHAQWGLFLNWVNEPGRGHGIEYSLVFASILLFLAIAGPGDYSIDGRQARYVASRAAGRARLRRA
jgi:putative oxidoreductase